MVDFLGPSILNEDGTINRPAMAQVIFGCPDKRVQVDRLTHPWYGIRPLGRRLPALNLWWS